MVHPRTQPLPYLKETPSQTAGPYVHLGLAPGAAGLERHPRPLGAAMIGPATPGQRIRVEGMVRDGTGAPVGDVLIEIWQADPAGIHADPADPRRAQLAEGFRGFARVVPDFATGLWAIETVKPGPVMGPRGQMMAPHLNFWLVARGVNIGLQTRMYFADEPAANAADPVLALIDQPSRRETLVAPRVTQQEGPPLYRFDIRLQGAGETVFFDI